MFSELTGRRPVFSAVARNALFSLGLVAALGLSACTTTEGTNAMGDFGTFEREVMTSTLVSFGVIDKQVKEETNQRRAPLVLPKKNASLPAPVDEEKGLLPEDSDRVQVDTTGLTEDDLRRLRNARVVDLRTTAGRPLTEVEAKQLTARMTAARLSPSARPIYLPPEEYFTNVGGKDLVCLAANGDLVPLSDKSCPPEIRKALQRRGATQVGGASGTNPNATLSEELGLDK